MGLPVVRSATSSEQVQLVATIVLSFAADPVARWIWPDPHEYLAHMPAFTRAFGGNAFANDGAHCTDDLSGVALWLLPGVHLDEEAMGELMENTVEAATGEEMHELFEQEAAYQPDGDYWFLPLVGVDPACRGRGYGRALLEHALRQCDEQQSPAYLDLDEPEGHLAVRAPRVRDPRHASGRKLAAARSDAARTALSEAWHQNKERVPPGR